MKNEMDEILSTMFGRSQTTGKSKAAEDAEAFLKSISKGNKEISKSLDKQLAEIEELNTAARSDMEEISKALEADGFAAEKTEEHKKVSGSEEAKKEIDKPFALAEEKVKSLVIGQDEFLHKLFISFKRPLVMGTQEGMPASSIVITGKVGTGRHSALNCVIKSLKEEGILNNPTAAVVDLSLYSTGGDSKLFIQDLFSAIESKADVILFENYDKCHKSLNTMVSDLVLSGKIQLGSRYANQKGMLIDVGTALVPGAISRVSAAGRYLVFITSNSQNKMADGLGAAFINGISDFCMTGSFAPESLVEIGKKGAEELCERAFRMLGFKIDRSPELPAYIAGKFTLSGGVNSMDDFTSKCYKLLSEYKLESSPESSAENKECKAEITDGRLCFVFPDKTIEVTEEKGESTAVQAVKAQLQEIIGLKEIKDYIFSLEENYKVQKMRIQKGLKADPPSMHMIFTGNPGTGKTTIARLVSRYLKSIGVLSGGQLIEVTRADLVGRFVGHTAPLTRQVIESAIGGVLFVDEAYSLYRSSDDSFGLEAIDALVKGMEDNRENLLVILAGYSKEMEEFLKSNSGLVSRFPNIIEFPDYSAKELWEITKLTAVNKGYRVNEGCETALTEYYEKRQSEHSRTAGNGRLARNLVENAVLNQSKRIIKDKSENLEELVLADFEF